MCKTESHPRSNFGHFQNRINTSIFAIRSCVPTESVEVIKKNIYAWEQYKKDG